MTADVPVMVPEALDVQACIQAITNVLNKVGTSSRHGYEQDMRDFLGWLLLQGCELSRAALLAYRAHLEDHCEKQNTRARKWAVVKGLVDEYVLVAGLEKNPVTGIKGFKKATSAKHIALSEEEAEKLLAQPDRTKTKGLRDYAIMRLLLRTGLRRSECARLCLGHMRMMQGHHILVLEETKSGDEAVVKVPVDVWRTICEYLEAAGREGGVSLSPDAPLFVQFDRGDHATERPLSDRSIYRLAVFYAERAGIERMTAHSTRASFITLALEKGAKLEDVQEAARHRDPRTTLVYHKRRRNLDNNAVDVLHM